MMPPIKQTEQVKDLRQSRRLQIWATQDRLYPLLFGRVLGFA